MERGIIQAKTYLNILAKSWIDQKGMTVDYDLCYSFFFSFFFQEGREKGKRITDVVVKSHAFLLDQKVELLPLKQGYGSIIFYLEEQDPFDTYISENMQYKFRSKVYQQCF